MGKVAYVMCPMCGWWHPSEYRVKPGRRRSAAEYRRTDFRIDISRHIFEIRELLHRSITTIDFDDVDGMADDLKDAMIEQAEYVLAVLKAPAGQRQAIAAASAPSRSTSRPPVSPAASTRAVKKKKVKVTPVAPQPTSTPVAPVPEKPKPKQPAVKPHFGPTTFQPFKKRFRYSEEVAKELLAHVDVLIQANAVSDMPAPEGDIENHAVLNEVLEIGGMIEDWVIEYDELRKTGGGLGWVSGELLNALGASNANSLARLRVAVERLATGGPKKQSKSGRGRELEQLKAELDEERTYLATTERRIAELEGKAELTVAEEAQRRQLVGTREEWKRYVAELERRLQSLGG